MRALENLQTNWVWLDDRVWCNVGTTRPQSSYLGAKRSPPAPASLCLARTWQSGWWWTTTVSILWWWGEITEILVSSWLVVVVVLLYTDSEVEVVKLSGWKVKIFLRWEWFITLCIKSYKKLFCKIPI